MLPSKSHSRKNISLGLDKKQSFLKTCAHSPGLEGPTHSLFWARGGASLGHCGQSSAQCPEERCRQVQKYRGVHGRTRINLFEPSSASHWCRVLQQDVEPCRASVLCCKIGITYLLGRLCWGLNHICQWFRLNHMKLPLSKVRNGWMLVISYTWNSL